MHLFEYKICLGEKEIICADDIAKYNVDCLLLVDDKLDYISYT